MAIWSTRSAQTSYSRAGRGDLEGAVDALSNGLHSSTRTENHASGVREILSESVHVCVDAGRHPSTFFLFVTLPVCLKVPIPSPSTPSHMVHHKEELLIQIQKDFKNSGGVVSASDGTPTDCSPTIWFILHKMELDWLVLRTLQESSF